MSRFLPFLLIFSLAFSLGAAAAKPGNVGSGSNPQTQSVPATGSIEVGFSPEGSGEALVIKVINSAKKSLYIMSYSFTSAHVTEALLNARHRGVQVALIADKKNNTSQDHSGKAKAAMSALVTAGAYVRTIGIYPIHHDKVIIADGLHVELGSFNYSSAAATSNSENVLVNWNNEALANVYLKHFKDRYEQGQDFTPNY